MVINSNLILIGVLIGVVVIGILFSVKFKKLKHEIFAVFLIAVLLIGVFSFFMAFKGRDISVKSIPDLEKAVKIYFSWFGNAVHNVKIITAQVVKMNWQGNKTA
jgi:hypothetical protein